MRWIDIQERLPELGDIVAFVVFSPDSHRHENIYGGKVTSVETINGINYVGCSTPGVEMSISKYAYIDTNTTNKTLCSNCEEQTEQVSNGSFCGSCYYGL